MAAGRGSLSGEGSLPLQSSRSLSSPRQPTLNYRSMLITASFGAMIPNKQLDHLPPRRALNVHPSLLPRYRGAAPIQWAMARGENTTGVTVQELSRGVFDHGDILGQTSAVSLLSLCRSGFFHRKAKTIQSDATYHTLERDLAQLGGELLARVISDLANDRVRSASSQQGHWC